MEKRYTVTQVAKQLRVSERTILREIKRGKLKTQKVGRRYLIPDKNLAKYLVSGSNLKGNIHSYLQSKKGEMIDLLQKMVSLPSVGYEAKQEYTLAKFICEKLDGFGIRNTLLNEGDAVAVRASYGYAENGVVLDCPLDTAPIGNIDKWEYPPFGGVIKGGKMYGRGTADSKAGIIAGIFSLLALKRYVDEDKLRLELIYDGGEQDGSYSGMEMVLKRGLHANAAIIGYADRDFNVYIGCRGYHRYTFKTIGEAAHTGSRSKPGINAIDKMVNFIHELKRKKLKKSYVKLFDFGQKMTFVIIQGGIEINVVPDECTSRLDFRTTPDYRKKYVDGLISETVKKLSKEDKEFNIKWEYDLGNEGYLIKENEILILILVDSIKQVYGKKVKLDVTGPSNIGTILAREGIPALIWGPRGGNTHSYNEFIEIDSLPKTAEIYAYSILRYFGID